MTEYHLAQINIGKARGAMDSEIMKGFVERLDEINALADNSPGFIWRLQTEAGDSTAIKVFDDPNIIINMSVWKDIESLKYYVYETVHLELLRAKNSWFSKMSKTHQALWWIPKGHTPTIQEGREKLLHLDNHPPSSKAFNFSRPFEKASVDNNKIKEV